MLTTKNMYDKPQRPDQKCPRCGHVGNAADFDLRLPGVAMCMDGHDRHFEVKFEGEDEPRKFKQAPTNQEIIDIMEELEKKPKRKKQLKMDDL